MRGGKEEIDDMTPKRRDDLEDRAYNALDEIERGRDESAKYDYLNIMTIVLFSILDSVLAIRRALFLVAGSFIGFLLTFIVRQIINLFTV